MTFADFLSFFTFDRIANLLRAIFVLVMATVAARLARGAMTRALGNRLRPQQLMLSQRLVSYGLFALALTWSLREIGFEISVLLGAAGVLTVAVGFASQTSVSNLISGLFLIVEQPFGVGDTIEADKITGEILSIDLLSLKLRTADNLFVRIPNETVLKSTVTNLTRYPTRACDIAFQVNFHSNVETVKERVLSLASAHPLHLPTTSPNFAVVGQDDAGLKLVLTVWAERARLPELRTAMHVAVATCLNSLGIERPCQMRGVYTMDSVPLRGKHEQQAVL